MAWTIPDGVRNTAEHWYVLAPGRGEEGRLALAIMGRCVSERAGAPLFLASLGEFAPGPPHSGWRSRRAAIEISSSFPLNCLATACQPQQAIISACSFPERACSTSLALSCGDSAPAAPWQNTSLTPMLLLSLLLHFRSLTRLAQPGGSSHTSSLLLRLAKQRAKGSSHLLPPGWRVSGLWPTTSPDQ